MASEILQKTGTSFVWANSDYSPGANTSLGTYSATYDIDPVDLAAAAARQSIKADLTATHAAEYQVDMTWEPVTDPAAGGTIDLYWSESASGTAAVGNMGGCTGADGAFTGYSTVTLAVALTQMKYIGSFNVGVANDADGVQIGTVGVFNPVQRYGCLVVVNNTSVAMHSVSDELAVRFTPIIPEGQ